MPELASWLNEDRVSNNPAEVRAVYTWHTIQEYPHVIYIRRGATTLPPQTVRIEHNLRVREDTKANSVVGVGITIVIGVRNHPEIADTDIKARDRFVLNGVEYEITTIIIHPGEIQAISEARF